MGFWKDGFSIDEGKTSALIISMVAVSSFAMYTYIKKGDFTPNMLMLLQSFIYGVAGVNAANAVGGALSSYVGSRFPSYTSSSYTNTPTVPPAPYVPTVNPTNVNPNAKG